MDYEKLRLKAETDPTLVGLTTIKIANLNNYFSQKLINKITSLEIDNVAMLIAFSETPEYITSFSVEEAIEVYGSVTILKCKYLNIDPVIHLNNPSMAIEELSALLGFRKDIRKKLKDMDLHYVGDLLRIIYLGKLPKEEFGEVYEKLRVVDKFNAKADEQSVSYLTDQLNKLFNEKEILDNLIRNYNEVKKGYGTK